MPRRLTVPFKCTVNSDAQEQNLNILLVPPCLLKWPAAKDGASAMSLNSLQMEGIVTSLFVLVPSSDPKVLASVADLLFKTTLLKKVCVISLLPEGTFHLARNLHPGI